METQNNRNNNEFSGRLGLLVHARPSSQNMDKQMPISSNAQCKKSSENHHLVYDDVKQMWYFSSDYIAQTLGIEIGIVNSAVEILYQLHEPARAYIDCSNILGLYKIYIDFGCQYEDMLLFIIIHMLENNGLSETLCNKIELFRKQISDEYGMVRGYFKQSSLWQ